MGAQFEFEYQEDMLEESRVGSLLNTLASSLEERQDSPEPWRTDSDDRKSDTVPASRTSNYNSHSAHPEWASQGDVIRVKWADLAREGEMAARPRSVTCNFHPQPKLIPGVGRDKFRSTAAIDADWREALSQRAENAFTVATAEEMASALNDLVSARLGSGLQESIESLQDALSDGGRPLVELPPGAAELDIAWELHRELEWNVSFKRALFEHLDLSPQAPKQQLLKALLQEVARLNRECPGLTAMKQQFQRLVQDALARDIKIEAFEPDEDDPFVRLVTSHDVTVPQSCSQDVICRALDEIGC